MNMAILQGQHDEISLLARDLRAAVSDASANQPVAPIRWRLARLLIAHLAVEDRYLYPAMIASDDSQAQNIATRFKSEMGALAAVFTAYMSTWTEPRIAADRDGFAAETHAVLDALERRVEKENTILYPLAPTGWISLPPLPALKRA